jgi:hypothetical protein
LRRRRRSRVGALPDKASLARLIGELAVERWRAHARVFSAVPEHDGRRKSRRPRDAMQPEDRFYGTSALASPRCGVISEHHCRRIRSSRKISATKPFPCALMESVSLLRARHASCLREMRRKRRMASSTCCVLSIRVATEECLVRIAPCKWDGAFEIPDVI